MRSGALPGSAATRSSCGFGNDLERLPRALIMGTSTPRGQHSQTQTVSDDDQRPGPLAALARVKCPPLPGPFFARQALCQDSPPSRLRFPYYRLLPSSAHFQQATSSLAMRCWRRRSRLKPTNAAHSRWRIARSCRWILVGRSDLTPPAHWPHQRRTARPASPMSGTLYALPSNPSRVPSLACRD